MSSEITSLWKGLVFYGEIYGDGIQTGYNYGLTDGRIDVVWFDAYDSQRGEFLSYPLLREMLRHLGFKTVPVLDSGYYNWDLLDDNVFGRSVLCPEQRHREGIVIRPVTEFNGHCGRAILKYINSDYLLLKDNTEFH